MPASQSSFILHTLYISHIYSARWEWPQPTFPVMDHVGRKQTGIYTELLPSFYYFGGWLGKVDSEVSHSTPMSDREPENATWEQSKPLPSTPIPSAHTEIAREQDGCGTATAPAGASHSPPLELSASLCLAQGPHGQLSCPCHPRNKRHSSSIVGVYMQPWTPLLDPSAKVFQI